MDSPPARLSILLLVCVIGLFNFVDRQVVSSLIEPIKREFGVSDSLMGLLTGLSFAGFYIAASVPIGWLADRTSRRGVLIACLAFWSLCTGMAGFAQSFLHLAMSRIGVAIGEAGGSSTSHAILSEEFPRRRRATVLSVFSGSQSIGIGLGIFIGGVLAGTVGWRGVFWALGAPGILLAAVAWLVLKPGRDRPLATADDPAVESFLEVFAYLWSLAEFRRATLVSSFASLMGYGVLGWGPTFFVRIHDLSAGQVGVRFGLITAAALVLGNAVAGVLGDRAAREHLGGYMKIAGTGVLLSVPCAVGMLVVQNSTVAFLALFGMMTFQVMNIAPCIAVIQTLAPPSMRAQASVLFSIVQTIAGLGFSPLVVGVMNDLLQPVFGTDAIRYSLLSISIAAVLAGVLALRGAEKKVLAVEKGKW